MFHVAPSRPNPDAERRVGTEFDDLLLTDAEPDELQQAIGEQPIGPKSGVQPHDGLRV